MSDPVGNIPRSPSGLPGGNSHKAREAAAAASPEVKEPAPKPQKIVEGKVITKKPNVFKRVSRNIIADDAQTVSEYIVSDVLLPAVRNLVYDIISQGSHRALFGTARGRRGAGGPGGPVTSLKTAYHRPNSEPERPAVSRDIQARHGFDEITLETRAEALEVLESMIARVERYGRATVADLYDYLGVTGSFTDQSYGWTNLDSAEVRHKRSGFLLDLPAPSLLR